MTTSLRFLLPGDNVFAIGYVAMLALRPYLSDFVLKSIPVIYLLLLAS